MEALFKNLINNVYKHETYIHMYQTNTALRHIE